MRRVQLYFQDVSTLQGDFCRTWTQFDTPHFPILSRFLSHVQRDGYVLTPKHYGTRQVRTYCWLMRQRVVDGQKAALPKFLDVFAHEKKTFKKRGGDLFFYVIPPSGRRKKISVHWKHTPWEFWKDYDLLRRSKFYLSINFSRLIANKRLDDHSSNRQAKMKYPDEA